jgi:hypothetical protein
VAGAVGAAIAEQPIELQPDTVDAFWAQLLVRLPDTIANHLKNAKQVAISGPNALEIVFPKSYAFSKNYCERPETVKRIQGLARDLAGHPVALRYGCEAAGDSSAAPPPPTSIGGGRKSKESVATDPFVQQVSTLFGGTVVEVRPIAANSAAEG